ncbi:unnamed protein product [marine sediment metagenome]|uniref:Uncharacterized protein n=1 Tax=marine sediment metagenome TaxID=412755 RepID=X1A8V3_9ZZZZ
MENETSESWIDSPTPWVKFIECATAEELEYYLNLYLQAGCYLLHMEHIFTGFFQSYHLFFGNEAAKLRYGSDSKELGLLPSMSEEKPGVSPTAKRGNTSRG